MEIQSSFMELYNHLFNIDDLTNKNIYPDPRTATFYLWDGITAEPFEKCIRSYEDLKSCSLCGSLAFKIKEFILSFFNCSEWQCATKRLAAYFYLVYFLDNGINNRPFSGYKGDLPTFINLAENCLRLRLGNPAACEHNQGVIQVIFENMKKGADYSSENMFLLERLENLQATQVPEASAIIMKQFGRENLIAVDASRNRNRLHND